MKSMPKSRKGAAPSDIADQERKLSQEIEHAVKVASANYLKDNPKWLEELAPAVRADVLKGQIPRPKAMDQDLEASFLSLSSSIEGLPQVPELTKYISTLKLQLRKALDWAKIERTCAQSACRDADAMWVRELMMQAWNHGVSYGREMRSRKLTDEDVADIIEGAKKRKARKDDAVES